jgi:hypothetical protein
MQTKLNQFKSFGFGKHTTQKLIVAETTPYSFKHMKLLNQCPKKYADGEYLNLSTFFSLSISSIALIVMIV